MRSTPPSILSLTGMLRNREVVLINDVETIKYHKEKELQLQKDELEFLLSGIRHAVLFSEALVKEGSDTEIVASDHQVVTRMATLTNEREKLFLEPVTYPEIEFDGGVEQLSCAIRNLGTVVATGISVEQSIISTQAGRNHQINQAYSFRVILVCQKGTKIQAGKERNKAVKNLGVPVLFTGWRQSATCPRPSPGWQRA